MMQVAGSRRRLRTALFWSAALCGVVVLTRPRRAAPDHGCRSGEQKLPSWRSALGEYPAVARLLASQVMPVPANHAPGGGTPVLVIPGFMFNDLASAYLRRRLKAAGYLPHGWGHGFNLGARPDTLDLLERRLDEIIVRNGRPVAVVGWSLGGLYARELAKRRPDDIALVVTLGSPFSAGPRDNRAWRLYEAVNDHPVDRPPVKVRRHEKPPVHTVAIWSDRDGIVAPVSACGQPGETDEQVRVRCKHNELLSHPDAVEAVLTILREQVPAA